MSISIGLHELTGGIRLTPLKHFPANESHGRAFWTRSLYFTDETGPKVMGLYSYQHDGLLTDTEQAARQQIDDLVEQFRPICPNCRQPHPGKCQTIANLPTDGATRKTVQASLRQSEPTLSDLGRFTVRSLADCEDAAMANRIPEPCRGPVTLDEATSGLDLNAEIAACEDLARDNDGVSLRDEYAAAVRHAEEGGE